MMGTQISLAGTISANLLSTSLTDEVAHEVSESRSLRSGGREDATRHRVHLYSCGPAITITDEAAWTPPH